MISGLDPIIYSKILKWSFWQLFNLITSRLYWNIVIFVSPSFSEVRFIHLPCLETYVC